jgi:hypothetical protein
MTEYDRLTPKRLTPVEGPPEGSAATPVESGLQARPASGDESAQGSPTEEAGPQDRNREGREGAPTNGGMEDLGSLFESTKEIQQRWHDLQAAFVDDPHAALRQARELNDEVVSSLASALDERKHALEQEISSGDTERLRIGLRQYHQMLDQILAL